MNAIFVSLAFLFSQAGPTVDHPVGQQTPYGSAVIAVEVDPPDGEVWIEGVMTSQVGANRSFRTPPLAPGMTWIYLVEARWGTWRNATVVSFRAGDAVAIRLSKRDAVDLGSRGPNINEGRNFGVDRRRLKPSSGYRFNGKSVSAEDAERIMQGELPNDQDKLHLAIIGPKDQCDKVLQDLKSAPELAEFRDRYRVQDYRPGEWEVSKGHVQDGSPTIYLQDLHGHVLHRQDNYDGPARLAGALRLADPTYNPKADIDYRNTSPLRWVWNAPIWVWGLFAAGLFLLWRGNGSSVQVA